MGLNESIKLKGPGSIHILSTLVEAVMFKPDC